MNIKSVQYNVFRSLVLLVFLISNILSVPTKGQNVDIHSLDVKIQGRIILKYVDSLASFSQRSSLEFCEQQIENTDYYDKPDIYCALLYKIGIAAFQIGLIEKSDSTLNTLLSQPEGNLHPVIKAHILYLKAKGANFSGRKVKSVKYAKECLNIYNQNNDIIGLVEINYLLSKIYFSMGRNDLALKHSRQSCLVVQDSDYNDIYLKALLDNTLLLINMDMMKDVQDQLSTANELIKTIDDKSLNGKLALIMGHFYYMQHNFLKADTFFDKSIEYYLEQNNRVKASVLVTWKAAVAMRLNQYNKAIQLNRQAFILREISNSKYLAGSSHLNIANGFISMLEYDSALFYIEKGEEIFEDYKNRDNYIRVLNLKESLHIVKNDFKNAFFALEKRMRVTDSLFNAGNNEKLEELESEFVLEQYEHQKEEMQTEARVQQIQKNINDIRLKFVLMVFFLVVISSSLLFIHFRNKNRRNVIIATQKLIFIQMNSHFVFNALTAIQSLIYQKQIESAIHYLTIFSSLINKIIAVTHKKLISLQTEMSFIMEFLQIQKLRFGDDLRFQLNIDDDLDLEKIQLPPMLSYPFIEYAVEECVQKAGADSMLIINVKNESMYINYEIVDVNLGFIDMEKCFIKRYGGQEIYCEQLTKERISVYNYLFKSKIIFAETKVAIEGTEYSALQFQIKK